MSEESEFDWSPLGEAFWTEAAATCGATELQARFACCYHGDKTATLSAKLAGYSGDDVARRQAGSRAAKSTAVMNMLAMAKAEAGGGEDGVVGAAEARRILSRLARGSDPNVRIKAIESINKLDQIEREQRAESDGPRDPIETLREIASVSPFLAAQIADAHGLEADFPMTDEIRAEHEQQSMMQARTWIEAHPDQAAEFLAMVASRPKLNGTGQPGQDVPNA
jgi:hypothetical protein